MKQGDRVVVFTMSDMAKMMATISETFHSWIGEEKSDANFAMKFVALMAWMNYKHWICFSDHDWQALETLGKKIAGRFIEFAVESGEHPAPEDERKIELSQFIDKIKN